MYTNTHRKDWKHSADLSLYFKTIIHGTCFIPFPFVLNSGPAYDIQIMWLNGTLNNGRLKRNSMIISNLKKEHLIPLRDALVELTLFVEKWQHLGRPDFIRYLIHYLKSMKDNIEICICVREDKGEGLRYLGTLLVRDWDLANDEYVGIPSCGLFEECQTELCLQYLILLNAVGSFFVPGTNLD